MNVRVHPIEDGGFVVGGTIDLDAATMHLAEWMITNGGYLPDEIGEAVPPVYYAGWLRWNPCSPRSCWDGGGHRGHIGFADHPGGRGNWLGVYFNTCAGSDLGIEP